MRRREFFTAVGGAITSSTAALAQGPRKVPRIGVLWQGQTAETHPYYRPLRDGFKDVGYAEGSLVFEAVSYTHLRAHET